MLAIPVVMLFSRKSGKQNKYFFYVFYPAHFLFIYTIMVLLK
ncbi:MAG: TraX family protein [Lachnospiraceae bacterium]